MAIRPMNPEGWSSVRSIYQEGIETGHATFESEAPNWDSFHASRLPGHRLIAETAYVAGEARGLRVGTTLLRALSASTEADGIWTIQASVFPENQASLKLHLANGYVIVGRRQRIARMTHGPFTGTWRDTILIEHRSLNL